jgi:hypothetical protein
VFLRKQGRRAVRKAHWQELICHTAWRAARHGRPSGEFARPDPTAAIVLHSLQVQVSRDDDDDEDDGTPATKAAHSRAEPPDAGETHARIVTRARPLGPLANTSAAAGPGHTRSLGLGRCGAVVGAADSPASELSIRNIKPRSSSLSVCSGPAPALVLVARALSGPAVAAVAAAAATLAHLGRCDLRAPAGRVAPTAAPTTVCTMALALESHPSEPARGAPVCALALEVASAPLCAHGPERRRYALAHAPVKHANLASALMDGVLESAPPPFALFSDNNAH